MGGLAKVLPITFALFLITCLASLALPGMSGFVSEITVFLGITSNDSFTIGFRVITIVLSAIGLILTPMYLLSMCRRVFFGPRIPALATLGDMNPRELTIALVLVVPTLMIGFWPRLASGIYDATTDAISAQIHSSLVALLEMSSAIG
jgi:NAD(P)H-quinone oxidoreductase subunit 4